METAPLRRTAVLCFSLWQSVSNLKLLFTECRLCPRCSWAAYCVPGVELGDLSVAHPFLTTAQPGSWLHGGGRGSSGPKVFLLKSTQLIGVHLKDKLWTDWLTGFVVRGVLLLYDKPSYLETNVPN